MGVPEDIKAYRRFDAGLPAGFAHGPQLFCTLPGASFNSYAGSEDIFRNVAPGSATNTYLVTMITASNLALAYAPGSFSMGGTASVSWTDGSGSSATTDIIQVTFGTTAHPQGLVITNGALTSLNMTVTSNMVVQGVTFGTTGLVLGYTTASNEFTLAGTAAVNINGIANLDVTFGQALNAA